MEKRVKLGNYQYSNDRDFSKGFIESTNYQLSMFSLVPLYLLYRLYLYNIILQLFLKPA